MRDRLTREEASEIAKAVVLEELINVIALDALDHTGDGERFPYEYAYDYDGDMPNTPTPVARTQFESAVRDTIRRVLQSGIDLARKLS